MSNTVLKKSLRNKLSKETIHLTRKEYDALKEAERMNAAHITNLIPLIVLRDKFGFGKVRLERYLKHYQDAVDSLNKGYLDLRDVQKVMLDEVKIAFYEEGGGGMKDFMSGVICIALFAAGVILVQSLISTDLSHDPKYNQMIQGDEPMLVQTSEVGDDVQPHLHRVWFNPVTEEYYYTVEVQE